MKRRLWSFLGILVLGMLIWLGVQIQRWPGVALDSLIKRDSRQGKLYLPVSSAPVQLVMASNDGTTGLTGPRWSRAWGHVALVVDGRVYNIVTQGAHRIPLKQYIQAVTQNASFPQQLLVFQVRVSPKELQALRIEVARNREVRQVYHLLLHNCATDSFHTLSRATRQGERPLQDTVSWLPHQVTRWLPLTGWASSSIGGLGFTPLDVYVLLRDHQRLSSPVLWQQFSGSRPHFYLWW